MKTKLDNKNMAILALAILVIIAGAYIGFDKYQTYTQQKQVTAFQQGYQYAILQVAQQAKATCQPVPLIVQDQTINIIAVDCLTT